MAGSAWLVLVSFAASLVLPYVAPGHASLNDDPRCTLVSFDGSSTLLIGDPPPGKADGHCAVCHWLRAIAGAQPVSAGMCAQMPEQVAAAAGPLASRLPSNVSGQPLSRAPPVAGPSARPAESR
jgi:hypothetical protein